MVYCLDRKLILPGAYWAKTSLLQEAKAMSLFSKETGWDLLEWRQVEGLSEPAFTSQPPKPTWVKISDIRRGLYARGLSQKIIRGAQQSIQEYEIWRDEQRQAYYISLNYSEQQRFSNSGTYHSWIEEKLRRESNREYTLSPMRDTPLPVSKPRNRIQEAEDQRQEKERRALQNELSNIPSSSSSWRDLEPTTHYSHQLEKEHLQRELDYIDQRNSEIKAQREADRKYWADKKHH